MRKLGLIAGVLGGSLVYAVLRYNVFKHVPIEHFPLFVFNKAICLGGLTLIGCSLLLGKPEDRRSVGWCGLAMVGLHVLISPLIFNSRYYAKFFIAEHETAGEIGKLTWQAEISMLTGVVGLILLIWLGVMTVTSGDTSSQIKLKGRLVRLVLIFSAIHVFFMGYTGWADFSHWPGMMPPITLVSFVIAVVLLGASWFRNNGASA